MIRPTLESVLEKYGPGPDVEALYRKTLTDRKIVVLDDDPTGVQNVHDISVYTAWDMEAVRSGFEEAAGMFFILTNSRSFTGEKTLAVHKEIAANIAAVSKETGKPFLLISRGDSTLRGHYPAETETLRKTLEALTDIRYDGEILCPFFREGGRFTVEGVHYVQYGGELIPAGETEFAQDNTFPYKASHLGEWCEEKTRGAYKKEDCIYIGLADLRSGNVGAVRAKLCAARNFAKVIVDAVDYCDLKVLSIALHGAIAEGKEYIFRSAAALTKILGGITDRPLLTAAELVDGRGEGGGIVLVGSHVKKTTEQLACLQESGLPITYMEYNAAAALRKGGLREETARVAAEASRLIRAGRTAVVFTSRSVIGVDMEDPEKKLLLSTAISEAFCDIIPRLGVRPRFIVAKGGITSSDVGVRALAVRRATVAGQIQPGIPVWKTGPESLFPGMSYVIFPGNIGAVDTLKRVVETLI